MLLHVKYGKAWQYPCVPTVCIDNVLVVKMNLPGKMAKSDT